MNKIMLAIALSFAANGVLTTPAARGDAYHDAVLASSPRGYFRLDESPGATTAANDPAASGGAAMNGTYVNNPSLGQVGIPGAGGDTAVLLDGNNQTITGISDPFSYSAYSLEAWVIPGSAAGQGIIVNTDGNPNSGWSNNLRIVDDASGTPHFSFYVFDGNAKGFVANDVVSPGQLYHLVATATNGGDMQLFVNGVKETGAYYFEGSPSASPLTVGTIQNYGQWFLGSTAGSNGRDPFVQNNFAGMLDEVAIYPTVLSDATIAAHYAIGVPEPTALSLCAIAAAGTLMRGRRRR